MSKKLEEYVVTIPDFPEPGIMFRDITSVIQDPDGLKLAVDGLVNLLKDTEYDLVVGPESRGFIFGVPVAYLTGKGFVPVRKKGKLPHAEGDLVGVDITKEYGKDQLYFRLSDIAAGKPEGDVFRVTFFDDVLATGGTAKGVAEGLARHKVHYQGKDYRIEVADFVFLVEIDALEGKQLLEPIAPVKSLIHI